MQNDMENAALVKEALAEMNAEAVSKFKTLAKSKIGEIASRQKQIKDLEAQIARLKSELRELTLESIDESVIAG